MTTNYYADDVIGILPVSQLALLVFVIAATQVTTVACLTVVSTQAMLIFVSSSIFAASLSKNLGRLF